MTMQSIGVTDSAVVEIISAYAANNQLLAAVASPPAWYVVGAFFLPASAEVKLEAIGAVSTDGNVMTLRLFDMKDIEPLTGSLVQIDTVADARVVSGRFDVIGGRLYQIQAQVIGASGFGVMRTATLLS